MKYLLAFTLLVSILACNKTVKTSNLENVIASLSTPSQKQAFLENIYDQDQGVRTDPNKEKDMKTIDASNLEKIEAYLNKWGYPDKKTLGEKAASTPWIVIHHQAHISTSEKSNVRRKHFKLIYQAYLDENLNDTQISFYLNRIYHLENGKRFEIVSPYQAQSELNQLMDLLNLTPPTPN